VGVAEDPVTGSLNASLAQWLMADGHMPPTYSARQGTVLGRAGQVFLSQDSQRQVWVAGDVVACIQGTVSL
jgi:predicted PhzF superfamily epimerase YddE/YHI9